MKSNKPRKLVAMSFIQVRLKHKAVRHILMKGQPQRAFDWLLGSHMKKQGAWRSPRCKKILSLQQIGMKIKAHRQKIQQQEKRGVGPDVETPEPKRARTTAPTIPPWTEPDCVPKGAQRKPKALGAPPAASGARRRQSSESTRRRHATLDSQAVAITDTMEGGGELAGRGGAPSASQGGSVYGDGDGSSKHFFNFQAILEGKKMGQARAGASRKLQTLQAEKKRREADKLEKDIKCFDICEGLAPETALNKTTGQLQAGIKEIRSLCGIEAPLSVHYLVTSKFAGDLIMAEKWEEIAQSLRVFPGPNDRPYNERTPYLSALYVKFGMDAEENARLAADTISEVFFGDLVLQLFKEPKEKGKDPAIFKLCCAILKAYDIFNLSTEPNALADIHQCALDAMDEVYSAARCVVALISPVPGLHSAQYSDVEALLSDEKTAGLSSNLDAFKTSMNKSTLWKRIVEGYWSLGLEDARVGDQYQEYLKIFGDVGRVDEVKADEIRQAVLNWERKLRPNACEPLKAELEKWVIELWPADQSPAHAAKTCRISTEIISLLDPRRKNRVLKEIADKAERRHTSLVGDEACQHLREIVSSWAGMSAGPMGDLMSKVDACTGVQLPGPLQQELWDFRGRLLGELVECVTTNEPREAEEYVKNFRTVHKKLHDMGQFAEKDTARSFSNDFVDVLLECASAFCSWRIAVEELKADGQKDEMQMQALVLTLYGQRENMDKIFRNHLVLQADVEPPVEHPWLKQFLRIATEFFERESTMCQARFHTAFQGVARKTAEKIKSLRQVAGGKGDGTSWKADLDGTESIGSHKMVTACQVLKEGYETTIQKRIDLVKEAHTPYNRAMSTKT